MSRLGTIMAFLHAAQLPSYDTIETATESLLKRKDAALNDIASNPELINILDFSPESLKDLEKWYFLSGQPKKTSSGLPVNQLMGFYFGEVLCRNGGFKWNVEESPFAEDGYEIVANKGLVTFGLTNGMTPRAPEFSNKRMQSMWKDFERYSK